MSSFGLKVDPREAQYARFVGNVLNTLRSAVARRTDAGVTQRQICDRIDMDCSSMSRALNGRVSNLTLKTVSDILWAAEFEPKDFSADALEDISPNYCPLHLRVTLCETMPDADRFVTFVETNTRGNVTFSGPSARVPLDGMNTMIFHTIDVSAE